MVDQNKINNKIYDLNLEYARETGNYGPISNPLAGHPQVWEEFPGYNALTKFDFNNGSPIFSPASGVPIKAFLNTRTGEIRTFVATIFEQ